MCTLIDSLRLRILLGCVILTFTACVSACSSSIGSFNSLADQGILPLSTENPHLGSNLFLAQEAERSSYLLNFLKGRGGPTAIEIMTRGYSTPRLLMFYPLKKEVFFADLAEKGTRQQWIVRGPFQMEREDYRDLAGMQTSMAGEPVFLIWGKETRFRFPNKIEPAEVLRPIIPTPVPTLPPKKKTRPQAPIITDPFTNKKGEFQPLNSDQQAISMSQGFAERADNGDVIHSVKADSETFALVSRWYTGTPGNASALAGANGLTIETPLVFGMRVRIPQKLVRQFKAMPSDYK